MRGWFHGHADERRRISPSDGLGDQRDSLHGCDAGLLIIFMVAAPLMIQGIDANLPETTAQAIPHEENRYVMSISQDRGFYTNESPVSFEAPGPEFGQILESGPEKRGVILRADRKMGYGFVMEVMAAIRAAGIQQSAMVTEPPVTAPKDPEQ